VKQKIQYFVKLRLIDNQMSNQTVVAVSSLVITVNKYYLNDRLIDFYASDDDS